MTSHYVLKIQYVNKPPETRNIGARVTTIGREAGDIVLGDPQSSGRHAEIHFENGMVRVKDLGSTNGTFFNGQRTPEFALQAGQGFSIGQTVMTLMSIQDAQQRPGAGKTMIAMGGMPPRPPGAPPGAPPRPPGAPPPGPGGFGAPPPGGPPQGGFGAPPPSSPPGAPPPGPGGFGAPPAGAPPGAPPQGGFGGPPPGAPPQAQGGFGGPPSSSPPGAPPQGGFGGPPSSSPGSSPQDGGGGFGGPPQGGGGGFGGPPQGGPPQGGGYGGPGDQPGQMAASAGNAFAAAGAAMNQNQQYGGPPQGPQGGYGGGPMAQGMPGGEIRGDFSGTGGELFGQLFVGFLLTAITFGIYMPWFQCKLLNFLAQRITFGPTAKGTVRAQFDGQGGELFVLMLVNGLLVGITFGIYMPWYLCKLYNWIAENVVLRTDSGEEYRFRFEGQGGDLFVTYLVGAILTGITFGIYAPWFMCKLAKWMMAHAKILKNGQEVGGLEFTGEGGDLFVTYLVGAILTMITFGIYFPWFQCKLLAWQSEHTKINVEGKRFGMRFTGQGGELFVIGLVGGLLMGITLGIYYFWFLVKLLKWQLSNLVIQSEGGAPMAMGAPMGGGQIQQFGGPPQGQMYGQPPQGQLGAAQGGYGGPPQGGPPQGGPPQGGFGGPPQGGGYGGPPQGGGYGGPPQGGFGGPPQGGGYT